jgi:hypothetical protein
MIANHTLRRRRNHSVGDRRSNIMLMKNNLILVLFLFVAAILGSAVAPGQAHAQTPIPLPTLTPVPTATPQPMATTRTFHCNCFGPGKPVAWVGTVQAPNYFQASQQAISQCSGYLLGEITSPQIPMTSGLIQPSPTPIILGPCAHCACN